MILLIDNYDSFAHNLARYLRQLGQQVQIHRNDQITLEQVREYRPAAIVMSPGPCTPNEAGICLPLIQDLSGEVPLLGVCLGHQAICQAFGANVERVLPVHGQASELSHSGHAIFNRIPSPFSAGRYHSLAIRTSELPDSLEAVAHSQCGMVMAVAHRSFPVFGFQFHPESILTRDGYRLLGNFLSLSGIQVDSARVEELQTRFQRETNQERSGQKKNPGWSAVTPHPF